MEFSYTKNTQHEDLVLKAQQGDEFAFSELCNNYRPLYFKYFIKNIQLNFTSDEWYQQMQIYTYDLHKHYRLDSKRTFGSFLNVGLGYRIVDLQRSFQKKQVVFENEQITIDFDTARAFLDEMNVDGFNDDKIDKNFELRDSLERFIASLSEIEQELFFYLIGYVNEINLDSVTEKKLTLKLKRKLKVFLE